MLPTNLLFLCLISLFHNHSLAAPIDSPASPPDIDPKSLPYRNEHVLAANKADIPPTPPQGSSFCFRPIISGLTHSSCTPVIDAIRTLKLSSDAPSDSFSKPKTWAATTKSGPIYQWGIPGNPCKVKVVVDPALGPAVEVADSISKEDVEKAAKEVLRDCVGSEGNGRAGRRALGGNKGMFVTVGRVSKGEKL
ncbi:MAG: hypothetical protein Q9166_001800 [cf. Caloplaca sp. 2 TL-2023]